MNGENQVIFSATKLKGAYIIEPELKIDERGFFARAWCADEFKEHGLNPKLVQANIAFNKSKGTLRGMHYQKEPYWEVKLVRCTRGAIYDVILDLRPDSETYQKWLGIELNEVNHTMLYIPEGFAHGYLTLEDNTEVFYQVSEFYHPEHEAGIRWNDPVFGIEWPIADKLIISTKDSTHLRYK